MTVFALRFEFGSCPPNSAGKEVNTWCDANGMPFAHAFSNDSSRCIDWPSLGLFVFTHTSSTVRVWPAPGVEHGTIQDAFARVLQPIILQSSGHYQALHASAVVSPTGVLAFCGVGHSGKSTIAYALARAGCKQIADDAVVLQRRESTVVVRPLPFVSQLRDQSRCYFDSAPRLSADPLLPSRPDPDLTVLAAAFVLKQDAGSRGVQLERLRPPQSFVALLAHAHCFDDGDANATRQLMEDYLFIAERVPVFALTYRPGFDEFAELIGAISQTAAGLCAPIQTGLPAPKSQ